MSEHQFMLQIDTAPGARPQVRMWIDDPASHDFSSEREIALERSAELAWSARFVADGAFLYRIAIVATPASRWSLSFKAGRAEQELLFDADELTMSKEWLVGTCEPYDAGRDQASAISPASGFLARM